MGHLQDIQDSLHVIPNFISEEVCDKILNYCKERPIIFKDRKKHFPNYGLNDDLGNYHAAEVSQMSLIELWDNYFKDLEFDDIAVREVQINKYNKGAFIPPHNDTGLAIHTISVPLQTDENNMLIFGDSDVYYNNLDIGESVDNKKIRVFQDNKGVGYHFEGTSPIHWVPPVASERYSLILLF
jgi:hypothetical protein